MSGNVQWPDGAVEARLAGADPAVREAMPEWRERQRHRLFAELERQPDDTSLEELIGQVVRERAELIEECARLRDALADAGAENRRLTGQDGPVVWQYGMPDPTLDGPDGVVALDAPPRLVTASMVRRPMRPVGPWAPASEETTEGASGG